MSLPSFDGESKGRAYRLQCAFISNLREFYDAAIMLATKSKGFLWHRQYDCDVFLKPETRHLFVTVRINNLNFETWKKNHDISHEDKWCRELYPFKVFSRIDFHEAKIGKEQKIDFNWIHYYATITKIELQENGKYRATFELTTHPHSKRQSWLNRSWNISFQIIFSRDFIFITVYAKKMDPSKDYVVRFMKGDFVKITDNKSLPISELLFRTLLSQLCEESYPNGQHYESFSFVPGGIRKLPEHSQFKAKNLDFAPIYSCGRELWICYCFSEEKAHRIAYYLANQCNELIVVYCNPTYTRHHRCNFVGTAVLSLFDFANRISAEVRKKYEVQIRLLQNHLHKPVQHDHNTLLSEINHPSQEAYPINKSDLMEALGIMKILPNDELNLFYSLSGLNLINAYLSEQRKKGQLHNKETKLFRNMYFFKTYLANILTHVITSELFSVPIFIEKELIMVEILGLQFSFHNVPMNETLLNYEKSEANKEIVWSGKRLQPIASLIFHYAQSLCQHLQNISAQQ